MASKRTLNAANLEKLGAQRLAQILMACAEDNAALKRRLRLEVLATDSTKDTVKEIRKRLNTVGRSTSFLDARREKDLADDLAIHRDAIRELVAPTDPGRALDLMWQFLDLAESVYERGADRGHHMPLLFDEVAADLARLAEQAGTGPEQLAGQVVHALWHNGFGQADRLIPELAPILGERGLADLKARLHTLADTPAAQLVPDPNAVVGMGPGGSITAGSLAITQRDATVRTALRQIADAQGDVDSYIAQHSERALRSPSLATDVARRLLADGRPSEALTYLEGVDTRRGREIEPDWDDAYLDALEALERGEAAQKLRWQWFERTLREGHLRAYLKRLPEFDDVEAEEAALSHAERFPDVLTALHFLVNWDALERAANLVVRRYADIDGRVFEVLTPAADALQERYPLAATLLLRAMITDSLANGRTRRYRHAARHLRTCETLAAHVDDFAGHADHESFAQHLKRNHGRKRSFWDKLG